VAWQNTEVVQSVPRRFLVLSGWALRKVEERVLNNYYRRQGLDTAGPDFDEFDASGELRGYVPTDWRVLRKLFPPGSVGPNDVLLEYGSGKGRVAMWVASHFQLSRIIGVELDPDLTAAAQANLEHWRGLRRCRDVAFTCADARKYEVPDDVTIVYMFNPFMGGVFDEMVAKVTESLIRKPRPLRVIYFYPIMHDALIDAGFFLEKHYRHALYAWATYRIG
jgi:hypothetical protein